jgi:hypothetical protein
VNVFSFDFIVLWIKTSMKCTVLWDVASCSLIVIYWHFVDICKLLSDYVASYPEDNTLHSQWCENLQSHIKQIWPYILAKLVLGETINFSIILICVFDIRGIIHYESFPLKQSVKHSALKFSNILYRAHVLKKIQIFGERRVFCMMSVCLYTKSCWRSDFEWDTNTNIETCTVLAWLGPMWPFQHISLVEFHLELLEDI